MTTDLMGRNAKKRLDYFPMDIDIFQDLKIRKLIKYQGGKAVTVYALLLCCIYKEGYYMRWDKELPFICSELTGFEEVYISEVVNTCLLLGLFSKTLFDTEQVLTSKGIQQRYQRICLQSKRICGIDEYNLLTATDNPICKAASSKKTKQSETKKKSARKTVKPQPKQTEPRQGSERPSKAQKGLPTNDNSDTASPSLGNLTLDEEIELLKSDTTWLDTLQCLHHTDIQHLRLRLDEFRSECLANGKDRHDSIKDAKYHFNSWLRIITSKTTNEADKQRHNAKRSGSVLSADAAQKKDYGSSF